MHDVQHQYTLSKSNLQVRYHKNDYRSIFDAKIAPKVALAIIIILLLLFSQPTAVFTLLNAVV